MRSRAATSLAAAALVTCLTAVPSVSLAADADAAQMFARQNNCFRCHSVDRANCLANLTLRPVHENSVYGMENGSTQHAAEIFHVP